jgi:transcriptional regulator with XRE-family HTH domain
MAEDVRRLVGANVRRLRLAAGLSQAALSERMGVDRAYVSGLEKGERNPTIVTLWHTAKALGVKVRALFDEPASGVGGRTKGDPRRTARWPARRAPSLQPLSQAPGQEVAKCAFYAASSSNSRRQSITAGSRG